MSEPTGHAKPRFLDTEGGLFGEPEAVAAYRHRQPYPAETFAILNRHLPPDERRILDAGCGSGDLTVGLHRLGPVDAFDISARMIAVARDRLGEEADVRWWATGIESAPLADRYGLVAFGDSVHWLPWDRLFARLRAVLHPGGALGIVSRHYGELAWWPEIAAIIERHHTIEDYAPYDSIALLDGRFIEVVETVTTATEPFAQSLDGFVEALHSRTGCTRDRMTPEAQARFDAEVRACLAPRLNPRSLLELGTRATVTVARLAR